MSDPNAFQTLISPFFSWSSCAKTDAGKVRALNEDNLMSNDLHAHWAVADGMGGHHKGDLASKMIVEHLAELRQEADFSTFIDAVEDTLTGVNQKLMDMVRGSEVIIGSTVTGMVLREKQAFYYWAGDSRIYLFRDSKLRQLSVDHTVVEELLQKKLIKPEDVRDHPEKNVITRAVGSNPAFYLEISNIEVEDGDIFLLCSDGLEKEVTDKQVEEIILSNRKDLNVTTQSLIDSSLAGRSRDNVTVILVEISART